MTKSDDELQEWMADWQDQAAPSPQALERIRRRVRRQSLGMALVLAAELILAAGALIFLLHFALRHPDPMDVTAMAGFSLLVLWVTAFSLWNRRGLWRPAAETTDAFLALSIDRGRRRLRSLKAGGWLLAGEVALFIPWIWYRLHRRPAAPSLGDALAAYGFLVLVAGVAVAILVWTGRRARRELRALEALRGE
jgi:hypothetical protein